MDSGDESDITLSDVSDETIYVVIDGDSSDEENLPMQDVPQHRTPSTETVPETSQSDNSSSNNLRQHPNPIHLTIGSSMNGLNKCPVFYTNPPLPASTTDPLHVEYYELSTDPNFPPELPILISMFAEILRSRAPTSDESQNPPPHVLPLTSYPDYEPPPFRRPTLSIIPSSNNPSETSAPSEQTTNTLIQTTSESSNSATQKDKKRDCKRLNDNTNDTNDAIPKKRERRCEESSNDCMDGKANNASPHETSSELINDVNLENTEEKMEDLSD